MNHILDNGTVLPSGLLGVGSEEMVVGFNRSYRNTSLKAGIVIQSYAADDPLNKTGLSTEYDVQVIEQYEDKGTTAQIYRNCVSVQGFGSIADYFEAALRPMTTQTNKGTPIFKGQNGAIVLLQCLDSVGEKGVVVGSLIHPDRITNISTTAPRLSAEYNGVNIEIQNDGSCSLTFKGATDSNGVPNGQGNTVFQIKPDGSFEFNHATISINADKSGVLSINATGNANITVGGNTNVTVSGDTNLTAAGKTIIKSKEIDMNIDSPESGNGIITSNGSQGVIDMITGIPLQPSLTIFGDV